MLYLWGLLGSDKEINSKGPVISYVERGGGFKTGGEGAGQVLPRQKWRREGGGYRRGGDIIGFDVV